MQSVCKSVDGRGRAGVWELSGGSDHMHGKTACSAFPSLNIISRLYISV